MATVEPVLEIPVSLSAVFDSSDEDDLAEAQVSAHDQEYKHTTQAREHVPIPEAAAIMNPELLRLADEYREAGLRLLD